MTAAQLFSLLGLAIFETLYMTLASTACAYGLGLPLGVILVVTDKNGIKPAATFNRVLGVVINIVRSVPFLILLVAIMPITRAIVGTTLGSTATMVPLVFAAVPFVARMVESSLKEVDHGVVEAAQAMGAGTLQVITKVLLPEAKPSLLMGAAIAVTTILGYSAMAGATGGGGLGAVAINYGYHRREVDILLWSVLCLIVIVQLFQEAGTRMTKRTDKRNH